MENRVAARKHRTRFNQERECELDMRCLVRDWRKLRETRNTIQNMLEERREGAEIDEIQLARLKIVNKTLTPETSERFGRLHRRMDRIRAQNARIHQITSGRCEDGVRTSP
jgi:hypothetical protein